MGDDTESDNTAITPEKKAQEAYYRSWEYTAGTYVAKVVASMAATALVAGALTSAPAVIGGTVLASAATTASTATSLAMRSGSEKQIAKDVFTYKALGHKDYSERARKFLGEEGKRFLTQYFKLESLKYSNTENESYFKLFHESWNSKFGVEKGDLNFFQRNWDSFFDNFKEDDVLEELKILVKARKEQTEGQTEEQTEEQIIELGKWTRGDKNFIIGQIDKLQESIKYNQDVSPDSKKKLELLSELYAKLKLNLYDRNDSRELIASIVTGATVGLAGAGATAIWHNPFATTTARAVTASAIGASQGKAPLQNFLIAEASAEFGAAISAEVGHVEEEFRYSVAKEFDKLSPQQKEWVLTDADIGLRLISDRTPLSFLSLSGFELNKLHDELNKFCEDFTAVKQADEAGDNNVEERRLSGVSSGDTDTNDQSSQHTHMYQDELHERREKCKENSSFQNVHMYWDCLHKYCEEKFNVSFNFAQWVNKNYPNFHLHYKSDSDGPEAIPIDQDGVDPTKFGAPPDNHVNEETPYSIELYALLRKYEASNEFEELNANTTPWYSNYHLLLGVAGTTTVVGASIAIANITGLCSTTPPSAASSLAAADGDAAADGTDAGGGTADATPDAPTDENKITNGDIKKAFMMSGNKRKVRYYSIGNEFTESDVSDKTMAIQAIEGDFNKLEKNTGVILSSEVAKAEGKEDPKTISIVINKQQSEIGDILFRDARFDSLDNKDKKFYFKLSYKEGSPTLKIMRDDEEINHTDITGDAKKIFDSITFNIIVKEKGQEKQYNFEAKSELSTGSFNFQEELNRNEDTIFNKGETLSAFAQQEGIQIGKINPQSPSSDPSLLDSDSRGQGR